MERHLPNFIYTFRGKDILSILILENFLLSRLQLPPSDFNEKKKERTGRNSTSVHRLSAPCWDEETPFRVLEKRGARDSSWFSLATRVAQIMRVTSEEGMHERAKPGSRDNDVNSAKEITRRNLGRERSAGFNTEMAKLCNREQLISPRAQTKRKGGMERRRSPECDQHFGIATMRFTIWEENDIKW